jgi:hypothetical protein
MKILQDGCILRWRGGEVLIILPLVTLVKSQNFVSGSR